MNDTAEVVNSKGMHPVVAVLVRLGGRSRIRWYIAAVGLVLSLIFSLVVFPEAQARQSLVLDPDRHGELAHGLLQLHSFSYYPDSQPTVERGPLYPVFMAATLWVSHDWWPYSVQVGQGILFAITILLVFWTSERLWSRPVAVLTAGLCALHPVAIWYTGRVWIETTAMCLFTAMVAASLQFTRKPSTKSAAVLGIVLGLSSLCKSTFLPYVGLAPFLMWMLKRDKQRLGLAFVAVVCGMLVIAPWTIRNWRLTGKFIPVHVRLGYNLVIGDGFADHIKESPFAIYKIWYPIVEVVQEKIEEMPRDLKVWEGELWLDNELLKISMDRYSQDPTFVLKKIAINSVLFWTLGVTPTKTLAIGSMMLILAALTVVSAFVIRRRGQLRGVMGVHLLLILCYYAMHLPVEAIARYSVILVPAMIMYGVGPIMQAIVDRGSRVP